MSDPDGSLLIVGAGQAGMQVAASARESGWRGPVTLIGAEPHPPYARPPLSKALLASIQGAESLALRAPGFYLEHGIDLVLGERIERLELASGGGGGGMAVAVSGREWAFDRLVLATCARPRSLPLPGASLDGVLPLRDIGDAGNLAARFGAASRMVVIGGGLIGLEVAAAAVAAGLPATVVETAPVLLGRVVSPATAAVIEAAHRAAGVRVLTGMRPRQFLSAGQVAGHGDGPAGHQAVSGVELEDGATLAADLVLVATGARPRDELARAAGLRCDNGIVVDEFSLASDGWTIAVGDCANLPDPSPAAGMRPTPSAVTRLRLESVDNAVEQARAAASTLAGRPLPYRSVPWFWSDQGSLKLQIAGLARPEDEVVTRRGSRPGQHTALRYRDGILVAAECVNSPADFLTVRKALASGISVPPDAAADTSRPLKKLIGSAGRTA